MKVPEPLVKFLKSKRITKPTPIQLQGIPTAYVRAVCPYLRSRLIPALASRVEI